MDKSMKEQLNVWKQKNMPVKKKKRHKKKKKQEKLSEYDLKELMGMNMATYTRHKGAFRQK